MSSGSRRRAMAAIVAVVFFWPFAHLYLVAQYRVDPWELFGWAMYSRPAARVQVRVNVDRDGVSKLLRATGAERKRVVEFARDRSALGEFASPATLVQSVFDDDPGIQTVEVVVREITLDLDTARLVATDEVLRFDRPRSPRAR